ncbi:MAG: peptide deformylase [Planctomycetes bacterium]|nr:peptide deformylase [Planctomycetota bacterium]
MELRKYPDPVLLKRAAPVTDFDDALRAQVAQMWDIMYASEGVGLAAPQVGWSVQLLILNPSGSADDASEAMVVINPRLVKKWGRDRHSEGCLSFPDIYVDVTRPKGVRLHWHDEHGVEHEEDFDDFRARILQHEMDHLEGVLLVHRMSPVDKIRYRHELGELRAIFADAAAS